MAAGLAGDALAQCQADDDGDGLIDLDVCLAAGLVGDALADCQAEASEPAVPVGSLIDADLCIAAGLVGDALAQCQGNAGGDSLVALDACLAAGLVDDALAQCQADDDGDSLIDIDICLAAGLAGEALAECQANGAGSVADADLCVAAGLLGDALAQCQADDDADPLIELDASAAAGLVGDALAQCQADDDGDSLIDLDVCAAAGLSGRRPRPVPDRGDGAHVPGDTGTTVPDGTPTTVAGDTGSTLPEGSPTTVAGDTGSTVAGDTGSTVAGDTGSTVPGDATAPTTEPSDGGFRIATFNASLNRTAEGELVANLSTPDDPQAAAVAEIIQRTRPDIVLLNEFDYVEGLAAVDLFRDNYLAVSQNGADPIEYEYAFTAPSNTGIESGFDLNNDGTVGGPDDAFGFGEFPGQYGMVVLSRFPIVTDEVRTFQNLTWASMPGARLPDDPATPEPADWYSAEELAVVRLSSKSHWDVPVDVNGRIVHVLAAHPTPPVFDGEEDRNGMRNADEIRFWADYIASDDTAWMVDDAGSAGGLAPDAEFVIVGDQNSDPVDGDSLAGSIQQLLDLERVQDPVADERRRSRSGHDPGRGECEPRRGSGARHRRLHRRCARQHPRRLRAPVRGARSRSTPASSGRRPRTRCRVSPVSSRSRARTIDSCGSTSPDLGPGHRPAGDVAP